MRKSLKWSRKSKIGKFFVRASDHARSDQSFSDERKERARRDEAKERYDMVLHEYRVLLTSSVGTGATNALEDTTRVIVIAIGTPLDLIAGSAIVDIIEALMIALARVRGTGTIMTGGTETVIAIDSEMTIGIIVTAIGTAIATTTGIVDTTETNAIRLPILVPHPLLHQLPPHQSLQSHRPSLPPPRRRTSRTCQLTRKPLSSANKLRRNSKSEWRNLGWLLVRVLIWERAELIGVLKNAWRGKRKRLRSSRRNRRRRGKREREIGRRDSLLEVHRLRRLRQQCLHLHLPRRFWPGRKLLLLPQQGKVCSKHQHLLLKLSHAQLHLCLQLSHQLRPSLLKRELLLRRNGHPVLRQLKIPKTQLCVRVRKRSGRELRD